MATSAQLASAEVAVNNVLDDWHRAAAEADEERYFSHFDPAGIFMGTDATERWTVEEFRAYAHPHFAEGEAWTFRATRRAVRFSRSARVAWFDEDLETEGLGPARGTGVLCRGEDGRYRIVHYSLTITIPNERFAEVKALLEGNSDAETESESDAETDVDSD
jgi:hypothetical protein